MWSVIRGLDHSLSLVVFQLQLPAAVESLLSIPACWFGVPFTAMGIVPWIIVALNEPRYRSVVCGLVAVCASLWLKLLWEGIEFIDLLIGTPLGVLAVPPLSIMLARWIGQERIVAAVCTNYCAVQTVTSCLKIWALRVRPCAHQEFQLLSNITRSVPLASSRFISGGLSQIESFPSGDTAGAFMLATVVALSCKDHRWYKLCLSVAYGVALVTGFCRLYFHAHFFVDVCTGAIIGGFLPLGLVRVSNRQEHLPFDCRSALCALFVFVIVQAYIRFVVYPALLTTLPIRIQL